MLYIIFWIISVIGIIISAIILKKRINRFEPVNGAILSILILTIVLCVSLTGISSSNKYAKIASYEVISSNYVGTLNAPLYLDRYDDIAINYVNSNGTVVMRSEKPSDIITEVKPEEKGKVYEAQAIIKYDTKNIWFYVPLNFNLKQDVLIIYSDKNVIIEE